MAFDSVLFEQADRVDELAGLRLLPATAADLQLDHIIDAVAGGVVSAEVRQFFYQPLRDERSIMYRQMVCRDLENGPVREGVDAFTAEMALVRNTLERAAKLHYRLQGQELFLAAVERYTAAVTALSAALGQARPRSAGMAAFADYVREYLGSAAFTALAEEARQVRAALISVSYTVLVRGGHVTVARAGDEPDYAGVIDAVFHRFLQRQARDYRVRVPEVLEMDHVQAMILDRVALLFPGPFAALERLCTRGPGFQDPVITRFDDEVTFYTAYLRHVAPVREAGLPFTYPIVSAGLKTPAVSRAFDLALAAGLVAERKPVVCNDFALSGPERILLVSGPNQGGKTTFARTVGQLHHLAALGLPVPAAEARVGIPDRVLTHFEREEKEQDKRGKLMDDLVRIRDVLDAATPNSLILLNEIFTSTALEDAIFLGTKVLERIVDLDVPCVCVTFVDELLAISPTMVSMVSLVDPHDPSRRTFQVVRKPADGLAYARVLAEKYRVTYTALKERIPS